MNKSELINLVAEKNGLDKIEAGLAVETIFEAIQKAVAQEGEANFVGFGSFKAVERAERIGRNPSTGEEILIEASVVPKFTPGATFKKAVADK